jgi:hypothetical protein
MSRNSTRSSAVLILPSPSASNASKAWSNWALAWQFQMHRVVHRGHDMRGVHMHCANCMMRDSSQ